jgi:hypothetical protein
LNQNTEEVEERLVKSTERVRDHGEVFTPSWMVKDMLDLVKTESERIDSRFLETACGSGNFLRPVLKRKLATVQSRYGKSDFERRHYALFSLMCIYGIELLEDNVEECRASLLAIYIDYLRVDANDVWAKAATVVLNANILQGDALAMTNAAGEPITFSEWAYLGGAKFQRREFGFEGLDMEILFKGWGDDPTGSHFSPGQEYPPMTVEEIAQ